MARPKKKALDYFPFDVDFFGDDKIKAVASEFNIKGEIVAVKLLCAIYSNGYFVEWNETTRTKMLGELRGISEGLLDQIVSRLARWGFFDKGLFDSARVLTSQGIQKRYFEVVERCKRQVDTEGLEYLLVEPKKTVSSGGKGVSAVGKGVSTGGNPTKEKETKVSHGKETKVSSLQNNHQRQQPRVYASVREEVAEMKNSPLWIENVCMRFHMSLDELSPMLDDFAFDCECRGKVSHDNLQDTQNHFVSWMEKKQEINSKSKVNAKASGDAKSKPVHKWQGGADNWYPGWLEDQRRKERRWQG